MKNLFLWNKVFFNVEEYFKDLNPEAEDLSKLLKRKPCWPSQKHLTVGVN